MRSAHQWRQGRQVMSAGMNCTQAISKAPLPLPSLFRPFRLDQRRGDQYGADGCLPERPAAA